MKFEVLTAVKVSMVVFWVLFSPEDGGRKFFKNNDTCLYIHMSSQPRRPPTTAVFYTYTPEWL
jgi:hypothetical protein